MSLVDLKSDLAKYRSEVTKEGKSTPEASSATNDKNFATQQPITDGLYKEAPKIRKPKVVNLTSQLGRTKLDDIKTPKPSDVTKRLGTTELDNTVRPRQIDLVSKLDSTKLDEIVIPPDKRIGLEDRLETTKLDNIIQNPIESVLINSVSEFSPVISNVSSQLASGIGLDQIESKFSNINTTRFVSRLNESDTLINRTNPGENNNRSDIGINVPSQTFDREDTTPDISKNPNDAIDNITNPEIDINVPVQTLNREEQAVVINKNILSPIGNITNPQILITRPSQFFDREEQTLDISRNPNDAIDNIIIPEIEPIIPPLSFSRQEQSPNIITDTIQDGLVVNPNVTVLRIDQTTIHTNDASELNIDASPIRFIGTSQLAELIETDDKGPIRYEGQTMHDVDNSELNPLGITPTIQGGRHENPSDSLYSVLGLQEVNFFSNQFAIGFNQRQQLGDSKYIGFSQFVWTGDSDDGPFTNYFSDKNAFGFQIKVNPEETAYQPNTSQYDFAKITGVNYFDGNNINTLGGFSVFTPHQVTEYKTESSTLGWQGNRLGAPTVDFFDGVGLHTTGGFNKFMVSGQSKYVADSSRFDFDGNKQQAPSTNYFDQSGTVTTMGFHNFAGFMDSKYVLDASRFVWVGNSTQNAPDVNYFDQIKQFTNDGFHVFAQKFDTKYIKNSSQFVWDGNRTDAFAINFFDLQSEKTVDGFHTFAQTYDSMYIPDSSRFTWVGSKDNAPFVNYLDLTIKNATSGFDVFTPFLESKYIKESSTHTWNANRQDAPAINYFDLQNQFSNTGFHTFHALNDSKYIKDSSRFDYDGNKQNSPAVNYFDLLGKFSEVGFHTFPIFKESKYIKDSSEFDWDGVRDDAPRINYFDLQKKHTTTGFHTFAQEFDSKYVKESSRFDWDGGRGAAPAVNYFDLPAKFTNTGFHTFAAIKDSKYIKESSEFDWNGGRGESPETNYFDISKKVTTAGFHRLAEIYDTKYVPEISIYDWNGSRDEAPQVNYFDLKSKFTTIGFHRLAELYDSKYVKDSSEFTFPGKFPKAGIDYFDKEKLNQTGFTLNIQPKGTSKPPGTEYFHESSFYTFKGGRPGDPVESVIDFFENTNQSGFTMDIQRNEGIPPTEYVAESSRFDFDGNRPKTGVNYFPNQNQTGFTMDIMPKGVSNPDTEYVRESSEFDFDGSRPKIGVNYFPNDNQTGFTMDIMPKGSNNPDTEYNTESSRFVWIGSRPKNGVNYFDQQIEHQKGFTIDIMPKGSGNPSTQYFTESSKYTWRGFRVSAPEVQFFRKIIRPNNNLVPTAVTTLAGLTNNTNTTSVLNTGFKKFFDDKTDYDLRSEFSYHSTESGPNKIKFGALNTPVTDFFGFTPTQRTGFMLKMSTNDGTLYPIINPELRYNLDEGGRLSVAASREGNGLTTSNGEEFAPLSLGKRPWARNGTLASLENQIPNITLNDTNGINRVTLTHKPGSYTNKYEKAVKESALKSYLSKYAITDGQLSIQYKKLQLQPNSTQGNGLRVDPFILRGIQVKGATKNENWGDPKNPSDFRGLFETVNKFDEERINKWLDSPSGIRWKTLQDELYKKNPLVDTLNDWTDPGSLDAPVPKTKMFNISSVTSSIDDNSQRGRSLRVRHGDRVLAPLPVNKGDYDYYENVVNKMNLAKDADKEQVMLFPRNYDGQLYADAIQTERNPYKAYKYNRLIALLSELRPSAFVPVNRNLTADIRDKSVFDGSDKRIYRLSGKGPKPEIEINRASHPTLTIYDTSGVLPNTFPGTSRIETWFGPKTRIDSDAEVDNTYHGKRIAQYTGSNNTFDGLMTALSYLLDGGKYAGKENQEYPGGSTDPENSVYIQDKVYKLIQKRKPFSPEHSFVADRSRANIAGDIDGTGLNTSLPADNDKILDVPPSKEKPAEAPIKQYAAVAYGKLKKIARGDANRSHDYNDFRYDIENLDNNDINLKTVPKFFSSDPKIIDYKNNNLETKFGFGNPGKVGVDRSKPYQTNIKYSEKGGTSVPEKKQGDGYEFRGDRINIIDFKRKTNSGRLSEDFVYELGSNSNNDLPGKKDLITFYFSTPNLEGGGTVGRAAEAIVFRAAFDSITDNHKPSWSPQMYMGRGDPVYLFGSYERDVSFGFTVHVGSRDEMAATWRKLNYLASWTAPDYRTSRLRAPLCRLNIGHLFRKTPGFINSLTYTFDNVGGTWETAQLADDKQYTNELIKPGVLQLPKTIQVAVGFTVIGQYRPEFGGIMYNLYDDDDDTGLMPAIASNDEQVNFFRTVDTQDKSGYDPSAEADIGDGFEKEGDQDLSDEEAKAQGLKRDPNNPKGWVVDPENEMIKKQVEQEASNVDKRTQKQQEANENAVKETQKQIEEERLKNGSASGVAQGGAAQSDIRIKENIRPIEYGLNDIMKLNPVQYNMTTNGDEQVGFIAQEMLQVIPEVVYGQEGDLEKGEILTLSYQHLVSVLTKAMQEQQKMIENQSIRIDELENVIGKLKDK